jgi:hypothetical protein
MIVANVTAIVAIERICNLYRWRRLEAARPQMPASLSFLTNLAKAGIDLDQRLNAEAISDI